MKCVYIILYICVVCMLCCVLYMYYTDNDMCRKIGCLLRITSLSQQAQTYSSHGLAEPSDNPAGRKVM